MNCCHICKKRAREMFPQCYGRLLLLGLSLSFPPACLITGLRLFTRCIQPVGDTKKWLRLIVLPWFRNLRFQPGELFFLIAAILSFILLKIFVLNVFSVGIRRYILNCKKGKQVSIGDTIFWGFTCGSYENIVQTMFLRDLYVVCWSLLLLIPGIVKSLEYLAVPWLLAEHPEKPSAKVFRHGKFNMRERIDDAINTFILSSLLLWELLNAFISSLIFFPVQAGAVFPLIMAQATAVLFVYPYRILTEAEFYLLIKNPRRVKNLTGS